MKTPVLLAGIRLGFLIAENALAYYIKDLVIHDLVDHLWYLEPTYFACQIGGLSILLMMYGQTVVSLINRTKHGPSFTL